jgi:hypothetical protein
MSNLRVSSYQLKALSMMVERECSMFEAAKFDTLWVHVPDKDGRARYIC